MSSAGIAMPGNRPEDWYNADVSQLRPLGRAIRKTNCDHLNLYMCIINFMICRA